MLIQFLELDVSEVHKYALLLLDLSEINYSLRDHLNLHFDRDILAKNSIISSYLNHQVTFGDLVESYLSKDFGRVFENWHGIPRIFDPDVLETSQHLAPLVKLG